MEGYNISIIGKSGVGKSSLLNYLFGINKAAVGVGEPVTLEGFHLYQGDISGHKVNIYDSWGLEPGKEGTWLKEFEKFQRKKQREEDIKQWLHTVIYCISGEGKRIEDYEIDTINAIRQEKLKPVIVITKGDSRGAKEFSEKVNAILGVESILINNVEKTKGFGALKSVEKPFGKKDLIKQIKYTTAESLADRITFMMESKTSIKRNALKKRLIKTLAHELEKKSFLGYVSQTYLDKVQRTLNKTVKSENRVFSEELSSIASDAEKFYKDIIVSSIEVDLAADLKYSLHLEEKKENEDETALGKIVLNAAMIALLPVSFIPSFIVYILNGFAPTFKNKIPMYSVKDVIQEFKKHLFLEKELVKY